MKDSIKITLLIILMGVSMSLLTISIGHALDRSEIGQCQKWKKQSEQFVGFYITEWQKMQCDYHGITIDAPVK